MHIQLFLHNNVPDKNLIKSSLKENVDLFELNEKFNDHQNDIYDRIGIMWKNMFTYIPIGDKIVVKDTYTFNWFAQELFDFFSKISKKTIIDLISCDLITDDFEYELQCVRNLFPNLTINYSSNKIGNGNWNMNHGSIKYIYFTEKIDNYTRELGGMSYHSALIYKNASVATFGFNNYGQLSQSKMLPGFNYLTVPVLSILDSGVKLSNMKYVGCGVDHTVAVDIPGNVYVSGNNELGQLGTGGTSSLNKFIQLGGGFNNALMSSCGLKFSIVLKKNGEVWGFGDNTYGQLGFTNEGFQVSTPQKVTYNGTTQVSNGTSVACGMLHTVVLLSNKSALAFGDNSYGQLGTKSLGGSNSIPSLMVDINGRPLQNIVSIACGTFHTAVLFSNFTVATCGNNKLGQLGNGTFGNVQNFCALSRINASQVIRLVKSLACGANHTTLILSNGNVYSFGSNQYKQLGVNNLPIPPNSNSVPTFSATPVFARNKDGVTLVSNIYTVSAGSLHNLITYSNGSVATFGSNYYGQLGSLQIIAPTGRITRTTGFAPSLRFNEIDDNYNNNNNNELDIRPKNVLPTPQPIDSRNTFPLPVGIVTNALPYPVIIAKAIDDVYTVNEINLPQNPCYIGTTKVLVSENDMVKYINVVDLNCKNHKVYSYDQNKFVDVVDIIISGFVSEFIRIKNIPNFEQIDDLYITKRHPILYNNRETLAVDVPNGELVELPHKELIFSICTKHREFINICGIPVLTWSNFAKENMTYMYALNEAKKCHVELPKESMKGGNVLFVKNSCGFDNPPDDLYLFEDHLVKFTSDDVNEFIPVNDLINGQKIKKLFEL